MSDPTRLLVRKANISAIVFGVPIIERTAVAAQGELSPAIILSILQSCEADAERLLTEVQTATEALRNEVSEIATESAR